MTRDQKKIWRAALKQTRRIKDGLGMPVDKQVVETVAIMRLMGFYTSMSCGGHLRRATGGPYIMFTAPKSKKYEEQCKQISDHLSPNYQLAYKKARAANLAEQLRLFDMLKEFYKNRNVEFGQRLLLRTMGYSTNRLECQSADISQIMNLQLRKQTLAANRQEIQDFTDFLKAKYFKTGF